MKVLVVYDSVYGNTEKIARAIGRAIDGEVKVMGAGEVNHADLEGLDLLIVGAPTQAGRPTPAVQEFLNRVAGDSVKGTRTAAFDTRISQKWVGIFGYAAGKIGRTLKANGAELVKNPEGFFVAGKEGPLKDGEEERAAAWAREVIKTVNG